MPDWWQLIVFISGLIGSMIGIVGSLTWWLSKQFRDVRELIYKNGKNILDKLEYHEKHDDQRFDEIKKDVWLLRLRNAAIDGIINGADPKTQSRDVRRAISSSGEG